MSPDRSQVARSRSLASLGMTSSGLLPAGPKQAEATCGPVRRKAQVRRAVRSDVLVAGGGGRRGRSCGLFPFELAIVESGHIPGVELHDVEVGRKVEVARNREGRVPGPEQAAVGAPCRPSQDLPLQALPRRAGGRGTDRSRKNRKPNLGEG